MSEPKSKDDMTGDELREDALFYGFVMDDASSEFPGNPDDVFAEPENEQERQEAS